MRRDAPLAEDAAQLPADVGILERHDAVEELDERDLGSEVAVEARPLDANGARTDNRHRARDAVTLERLVGGDDPLAVGLQPRERARRGSGGEHQVRAACVERRRSRHPETWTDVGPGEHAVAVEHGDLVLLEQELDPAHVLVDDRVAACGESAVVQAHAIGSAEPEFRALLRDPVEQVRRLEERLGWDASAVQACPAQGVAFDDPHGQAQLRGADGAHVAHAAAQDQEVERGGIGHASPSALARSRPSYAARVIRQSSGTGIGCSAA